MFSRLKDASYRDDQGRDPAGEAGERPAQVQHPHVLRRDDDGEAEDEGQRAEHQAELPADLLHHPAAQQAAQRRPHRHYGLNHTTPQDTLHFVLDQLGSLKLFN